MIRILFLLGLLLPLTSLWGQTKVYYFPIDEDIAKPAEMRVEKALAEADRIDADVVVVHINTYGG